MKTLKFNGQLALACLTLLALAGCPPAEAGATKPASSAYRGEARKVLRYEDMAYEPNVRTVQFYRGNNPLSYPFLYLREPTQLNLEFDMLVPPDQAADNFWVSIVNCDHEWRPTSLLPLEFLEGIATDRIFEFSRSENTLIPYIHYAYRFPADGASFKRSGNYLLKVYRSGDENDLILTRRLIVADPIIQVKPQAGLSRMATDRRKIQRIDFKINLTGNLPGMFDPRQDLKVFVLQNFRWDNAASDLQPMFTTEKVLDYQFNAASEFAGGNEYRWLDIRTVRFFPDNIKNITEEDSVYHVELYTDKPRDQVQVSGRQDINGGYYIDVQEYLNAEFESDYLYVRFALQYPKPIENTSVYVYGRFCDWKTGPENELSYNAARTRYEGEILLKQGVYNYAYTVQAEDSRSTDETIMEGNHMETENYYTILVYFAPTGTRSPELVGISHINYDY